MAPIGEVSPTIKLDKDIYHGAFDPITGQVALAFYPSAVSASSSRELFGPLCLSITLRCSMSLHAAENRTSHAYIFYNERLKLFRKRKVLFDGPFRIAEGELKSFLFDLSFPRDLDLAQGEYGRLPPSVDFRIEAVALGQYGRHQGSASIVYTVSAELEMPGIDVDILEISPQRIQYRPGPWKLREHDTSMAIVKNLKVGTYDILPQDERPSRFLGKTKAALRIVSKPVYSFDATVFDVPKTVVLGQSLRIGVRIQPLEVIDSAIVSPDITVAKCTAGIVEITSLYVTDLKRGDSPVLRSSVAGHQLAVSGQDPTGPFTKAQDYTKHLTFGALPDNIPNTFHTKKLSRSYRLRIDVGFAVGKQTATMIAECPIEVLPTIPPSYTEAPAEAGPSRRAGLVEALPTYQETVAASS